MADQTYIRDSVTRKLRDMGDGTFAEVVHALPAVSGSTGIGGSVTTPAAAGVICTISSGSLPAGDYDVSFGLFLSGTTETQLANGQLQKAATSIITPLPTITGAPPITDDVKRVTLSGSQALSVKAIALATTGAVYNGWIIATRIA